MNYEQILALREQLRVTERPELETVAPRLFSDEHLRAFVALSKLPDGSDYLRHIGEFAVSIFDRDTQVALDEKQRELLTQASLER